MESLTEGATKCRHCGSYQNYQRFLNDGNAVLALLVAFAAVLTPLISEFRGILREQSEPSFSVFVEASELKITHLNSHSFLLEMNIRNSSNFDIILERVTCYFSTEGVFSQKVFFFDQDSSLSTRSNIRRNQDAWRLVGPHGESNERIEFSSITEIQCILHVQGAASRKRSYPFTPTIGQY